MLFLEATARRANRTYPTGPWSSPWLQSQFLRRGTSQCSPRKGLAKEDSYKCPWGRFKTLPLELEMAQWITMGSALARDDSLVSNTLIGKLTITLNSSSRWPDILFLPSFKYTCTHVPHTHITLLRNNKIWEKKKESASGSSRCLPAVILIVTFTDSMLSSGRQILTRYIRESPPNMVMGLCEIKWSSSSI